MLRRLLVAVAAVGVATLAAKSLDGADVRMLLTQGVDTTITIRASSSTLEFTPTRVSAKAGTRVRIRFVNEGTLPHNLVVPRREDDIDALALAACAGNNLCADGSR
jgi:plastocyanin